MTNNRTKFDIINSSVLGYQKRTSKSKKNLRKTVWKQKVVKQATRAIFLAKYVLQNQAQENSSTPELPTK